MKYCPVCNSEYDDQLKYCKNDGTELLSKSKKKNMCTNCGTIYDDEVKFCPKCGKKIDSPLKTTKSVSTKSKKSSKIKDFTKLDWETLINKESETHDPAIQYEIAQRLGDSYDAVKWIKKSAKQGFPMAQYKLGHFYKDGYGVEENLEKAFKCIKDAAIQDYPPAQYEIGWCYQVGYVVKVNMEEAIEWYKKAAALKNEMAKARLIKLGYEKIDRNNLSKYSLRELLAEESKYHDPAIQEEIGDRYIADYEEINENQTYEIMKSLHEDSNFHKLWQKNTLQDAIKWYSEARWQGNTNAKKKLKKYSKILRTIKITPLIKRY